MFRFLILTSCLLVMAGCAVHSGSSQRYQLNNPSDIHLSFSGRGAAAGPMFMGAMGPSGIAIGLAIDIGIAKDIEQNGFEGGFNLSALLADAVSQVQKTHPSAKTFFSTRQPPVFTFTKIGFVEPVQGKNVLPMIELGITKGDWQHQYTYPVSPASAVNESGVSFEQLKNASSPAKSQLQEALIKVLSQALADFTAR